MILNKRVTTDKDNVDSLGRSVRNQSKSLEVAKARSTPSARWQHISTSNSSTVLSTTEYRLSPVEQGTPPLGHPIYTWIYKNPPPVSRGGLTFPRPVSLPKWPHPLTGTTLPRFGRLARASAPLLMQDHVYSSPANRSIGSIKRYAITLCETAGVVHKGR